MNKYRDIYHIMASAQLLIYHSATEPPHELRRQIHAVLSAEWPGPGAGEGEGGLDPALHPTYFLLAAGDQLLSYARTIWAPVVHRGQSFKFYGLGDVITVPEYRNRGYARRIIEAATTHIQSDAEADVALLLTAPELAGLYRRSGWEYVPQLRVRTGECKESGAGDMYPMMLLLSAAAGRTRKSFARDTLVLPGEEW